MNGSQFTPHVFTADAVGEPGQRAFYVQARGDFLTLSFDIEKQQVMALADKLRELLVMIDPEDTVRGASGARDPGMSLEVPLESSFRIGTIGLAYDEEADRVMVYVQPDDAEEESEADAIRFMLRREQVRSFVLHAVAIVGEGRPLCQLCGLPMDPEGHQCPASNGHRLG